MFHLFFVHLVDVVSGVSFFFMASVLCTYKIIHFCRIENSIHLDLHDVQLHYTHSTLLVQQFG